MVPPKELVQFYKGELTENALLNKAATLAAQRDMLLKSKLPAGIVNARVKPLSRELHHLTKRVRRGPVGGMGGQMEEEEEKDEDEDDAFDHGTHGTVDEKDDKRHALQKRNQKGDRKG